MACLKSMDIPLFDSERHRKKPLVDVAGGREVCDAPTLWHCWKFLSCSWDWAEKYCLGTVFLLGWSLLKPCVKAYSNLFRLKQILKCYVLFINPVDYPSHYPSHSLLFLPGYADSSTTSPLIFILSPGWLDRDGRFPQKRDWLVPFFGMASTYLPYGWLSIWRLGFVVQTLVPDGTRVWPIATFKINFVSNSFWGKLTRQVGSFFSPLHVRHGEGFCMELHLPMGWLVWWCRNAPNKHPF